MARGSATAPSPPAPPDPSPRATFACFLPQGPLPPGPRFSCDVTAPAGPVVRRAGKKIVVDPGQDAGNRRRAGQPGPQRPAGRQHTLPTAWPPPPSAQRRPRRPGQATRYPATPGQATRYPAPPVGAAPTHRQADGDGSADAGAARGTGAAARLSYQECGRTPDHGEDRPRRFHLFSFRIS